MANVSNWAAIPTHRSAAKRPANPLEEINKAQRKKIKSNQQRDSDVQNFFHFFLKPFAAFISI